MTNLEKFLCGALGIMGGAYGYTLYKTHKMTKAQDDYNETVMEGLTKLDAILDPNFEVEIKEEES